MTMTAEAKRQLSATIRELRSRLLSDLHAATESAYRPSVRARDAGLDAAARVQRGRLEAWVAEQLRAQQSARRKQTRTEDDFRIEAEKQAAYTLLNRLIILRLMEASGLRQPAVVTGGWESRGYKDFRQLAPALARGDDSEGYAFLLRLVFEDLATELPGLYGPAGVADLIPVPAVTLRHVVEALDQPELASCWTDDMTLGWVYQYFNDPEREALDAKLNAGGKVEPYEIASKTQMFTERYMVDWLLQNSLGPMWLAMCKKHGWTPAVEADGTLQRLEERRIEWRKKRDAGEVSLTALMPLHTDAERCWAYYVPQPIPEDAVKSASESVRDLKILDPAVGSGHFLVVAFDLLVPLYREEARHRGEVGQPRWSDTAIVERILEHNLYGIDLDPRAVQIAAAAMWLKAQQICNTARPGTMNLVASNLRLASLPDDDPALLELRREVERETGIPANLTDTLVHALRGADHLGSLLQVDKAVKDAIEQYEQFVVARLPPKQMSFLGAPPAEQTQIDFQSAAARKSLVEKLEVFLGQHTNGDDLGLRLRGEQLAAGVRFARMVREETYDLVVGNPPYQGTKKMADVTYAQDQYQRGKADLYAAFLERGLQLVRNGGVSSLLTMRNWMFLKQYADLRMWLLARYDLRALGDFAVGAFDEVPNDLLSVAVSVFRKAAPGREQSIAQQPTSPNDRAYDRERTKRKRAAVLCQVGRLQFEPAALQLVPKWPLIYWWTPAFLEKYGSAPKIGDLYPRWVGLCTTDNLRFLRMPWEVSSWGLISTRQQTPSLRSATWVPYVKGADGNEWFAALEHVLKYHIAGAEVREVLESKFGGSPQSEHKYFLKGLSFSPTGDRFSSRAHRYHSVFGNKGASLFPERPLDIVCVLNSEQSRYIVQSLNPTVGFEVGDVARVPLLLVADSKSITENLEQAFSIHESHREPSVEMKKPGPSPWRHAQEWAQTAVDRQESLPLPPYEPVYDLEPPTDHLSFALGVSLGRFGAVGEGILDPTKHALSHALPAGICFLDGTLDENDRDDSLGHPAAAQIHATWATHGPAIDAKTDLRTWLRTKFFPDVHKGMYENRPIHWPLSSENKTFVAWVTIHRFTEQTLRLLLADHLHPTLGRLDGELADLRAARDGADKKAARAAEKRYDKVLKARDELQVFIAQVDQCADKGPPADGKCPPREVDARYAPDLDDGVMINSAALWPLLEPQWKDPKKWWKELASAQGKKDYDWSHLAMRYWPTRVDKKCQTDPSLGVAHGCFWRYHPGRAWAWELRLQDEIGPDFRIEEAPYQPGGRDVGDGGDRVHRAAWLREQPDKALEAVEREALRRIGRGTRRSLVAELRILEPGLWSARPKAVWAMELRVSEKQGAEFRLLSPDEPSERAMFQAAHPQLVAERARFIAELVPPAVLFTDSEDEEAGATDDEADPDELDTEEDPA